VVDNHFPSGGPENRIAFPRADGRTETRVARPARAVLPGMVLLLLAGGSTVSAQGADAPLEWPPVTNVQRPWTRWWWQGSAVDELGLTGSLEAYRAVGLGGVEITPIYGVAGYEDRFVPYLSPVWTGRLEHTLREAARLGMGVDLATGSGWPFGGPDVSAETAAKYVAYETYRLRGGERLQQPVRRVQEPFVRAIGNRLPPVTGTVPHPLQEAGRGRIGIDALIEPVSANAHLQALALEQVRFSRPLPLQALVAYSDAGEVRMLADHVGEDGRLDWTAPEGDWTLYAVFQGWHEKMVERAAPGGEGYVLDHFSPRAVNDYLAHFSAAFEGRDVSGVRAFFNDSYEVDDALGEADWTSDFFNEFAARRGYDLRLHLPALFGAGDEEVGRRVLSDYRQTLSDLLLDCFTMPWRGWAGGRGAMVRNQAHGAPGSILDLYAASDIPETEGTEILRFKFASSAAHVAGKPLASAEAATWLNEHFLSSLADVKREVDRYFVGGVNHVVYHGTAYSPQDAPWPGWLFYAAVHFSPTNPLWRDFDALNEYVARTQSVLQRGRPDNDVLLYLPIFDRYAERGRSLLVHFDGIAPFAGMTVARDAAQLQERGYAFDFISDRQVLALQAADREVRTGGAGYRAVVVPDAKLVPLETLEKLIDLAAAGATVIFHRELPADVPGLGRLAERQSRFRGALHRLEFAGTRAAGVRSAAVGTGSVLLGEDLEALLALAGVRREGMVNTGLQFIRRSRDDGWDYFIANESTRAVDEWVPFARPLHAAALFDAMTGETGRAKLRTGDRGEAEVRLQLGPGESILVRGYRAAIRGPEFGYYRPTGEPQVVQGTWRLEFVTGGPGLPAPVPLQRLGSWTELGGEAVCAFSGTARYTLTFPRPDGRAGHWRLDLGEVHESACVRLNGRHLGTLIGPSYELVIDQARLNKRNELEVHVSNLMANRIAAMDRRDEPWKRFYNVNFPAKLRENQGENGLFDASHREPRKSGLTGPVTLTPLTTF
jgi:hypothetical protein